MIFLSSIRINPCRVFYSVFVVHHRKDLWGPDALEFDPDGFLDERLHKYSTHRSSFLSLLVLEYLLVIR
ncbi:uncharacterized protein EDB91DRAFT_1173777 [Suillus paluster]|uniref:uncharacterized protein n=1 Tax=Suillus paluster TaxID=48578 RepID=UPI001B87CB65|nr:uncharacterized protein EDB91DRAFT_1173777 [Suillus paluster]KAG1723028.1 hypothetical protein EDB91DRAFT_1173777 [Suillus paluster]